MSDLEKLVLAAAAEEIAQERKTAERRGSRDVVTTYAAAIARAEELERNHAQLRTAAAAVLARWDSPQWQWLKHGPTADLMNDLRKALDKGPQ